MTERLDKVEKNSRFLRFYVLASNFHVSCFHYFHTTQQSTTYNHQQKLAKIKIPVEKLMRSRTLIKDGKGAKREKHAMMNDRDSQIMVTVFGNVASDFKKVKIHGDYFNQLNFVFPSQ